MNAVHLTRKEMTALATEKLRLFPKSNADPSKVVVSFADGKRYEVGL